MTVALDNQMVGFTTSIPVEILLAAGRTPVDLNNRFITAPDPGALVQQAEDAGLSRTLCAWIKGIYAWALANPGLRTIVAVTQGDCSNTQALMELLKVAGREVLPFDFPHSRNPKSLQAQMLLLANSLGTKLKQAEKIRQELMPLRRELARLDELTWQEGKVTGAENHLWLISSSDFNSDLKLFQLNLKSFLAEAEARPAANPQIRLGLMGVPPIMDDLHQVLEELGASVVFNETPRQFAMPPDEDDGPHDLIEQYLAYTYPYDVFHRLEDLAREVERRGIQGLIHYTQSFCFRQMQDIILRQKLRLPILTLEGDRTGPVDARTRMRLEAFADLLR